MTFEVYVLLTKVERPFKIRGPFMCPISLVTASAKYRGLGHCWSISNYLFVFFTLYFRVEFFVRKSTNFFGFRSHVTYLYLLLKKKKYQTDFYLQYKKGKNRKKVKENKTNIVGVGCHLPSLTLNFKVVNIFPPVLKLYTKIG